ncbi:MAG: stage II sporulation protein P [Bacilli bacterium]|nr:stage II sporulation protein P [Bacilli bacterium]
MKKKKIIFTSLIIIIFILTMYLSYTLKLNDLNDNFIHLITYRFNNDYKFKFDFVDFYLKFNNNSNYFKIISKLDSDSLVVNNTVYNTTEPIIYIYSTHSNEEYSYNKNDVYNIIPTVKTASYILEDELKKLGINSIIEEENTIDILNNRALLYKDSYKISRELLENKKLEFNSLSYFIDVHRDSVKKSITTTTIDDKSYAKVMFVLGLENQNYLENKKVITEINDYLNLNYPGLSRGIYEKKGSGVNGVYNQDFNKNTMLIEIGGVDNTIEEVSNSVKAIANALYNYINNHKTTN